MAKPGSDEARALAGRAVDLGAGPITGKAAEEALRQAETHLGMRCVGCGERVTVGMRFHRLSAVTENGQPTIRHQMAVACTRDECDFAFRARGEAMAMEMVEFAFLDDPPEGEPASDG
jgi:hypothetical protein